MSFGLGCKMAPDDPPDPAKPDTPVATPFVDSSGGVIQKSMTPKAVAGVKSSHQRQALGAVAFEHIERIFNVAADAVLRVPRRWKF